MVLRGFGNDNLSKPPKATTDPAIVERQRRLLGKGGAARTLLRDVQLHPEPASFNNMPGNESAQMIAASVFSAIGATVEMNDDTKTPTIVMVPTDMSNLQNRAIAESTAFLYPNAQIQQAPHLGGTSK